MAQLVAKIATRLAPQCAENGLYAILSDIGRRPRMIAQSATKPIVAIRREFPFPYATRQIKSESGHVSVVALALVAVASASNC